jgi:HTH-type transcriptional regulator/antitoxin HigA
LSRWEVGGRGFLDVENGFDEAGEQAHRERSGAAGKQAKRAAAMPMASYFQLVERFPLVPIQSDAHLEEAQSMLDHLLTLETLDAGDDAYLDVLSDLVMKYEAVHFPIEPPSDAGMLRFLMESKGVSQARVAAGTGIGKSAISEILSGKRPFSKGVIRKLPTYFHVDVSVLASNIG